MRTSNASNFTSQHCGPQNAAMLKKPAVVCGCGLQLLNCSPALQRPAGPASCRAYATAAEDGQHQQHRQHQQHQHRHRHHHHISWPAHAGFTPYDVFKQSPRAPYSKTRFYDLVKIYHPDRPCNGHPLCSELPPDVRLHRYRLVIAAHEILSDPEKRAAYDRFGTGWSPGGGSSSSSDSDCGAQTSRPNSSRSHSRNSNDPIFTNATWEDWEAWHNSRCSGKGQRQQHTVDNRTFTTFVVLLTLFGGALQASWIGQWSTGYEERLREINEQSMRFLSGRRHQTVTQMGSSEARVQGFLIRRDPSGYGLKEEEQHVYWHALNQRSSPRAVETAAASSGNEAVSETASSETDS